MEPIMDIYSTEEDINLSDVLKHHIKEYSFFTMESFFPSSIDGLIKVYRRIITATGRKDQKNIQKVEQWGGVVQQFHPHGGLSIHNSIAKLMQPFRYQIPLLDTHGDSGSYSEPTGAAPRYLRASISQFAKDVYLDIPTEALVYERSEAASALELKYYIPKIPMALCLGVNGIATGYRTLTMPRDINNVCELTVWFINNIISGKNSDFLINNKIPIEVAHLLLPMFPINCNILNKEKLLDDYSKGKYDSQISIEGEHYITKNAVVIKTIPYTSSIMKKREKFIDNLRAKSKTHAKLLDVMDEYFDKVDGKLAIDFKFLFKKRSNPWEYLDRLQSEFGVYEKVTPESRYLSKINQNQLIGPGQILDAWYRERYRALSVKFNKEQNNIVQNIHRLEGLMIIKDHVDEVVSIIKNSIDVTFYAPILQSKFGLSYYQAAEIGKMNIDRLAKANREDAPNILAREKEKLDEVKRKLLNIPQTIKDDVLYIKNKYGTSAPQATKYPVYIGYIKIENGNEKYFIQLTSLKELKRYKDLDNFEVRIYPSKGYRVRYLTENYNYFKPDTPVLFPKHFITTDDFLCSPSLAINTVILNDTAGDKTIYYVKNLCCARSEEGSKNKYTITGNRVLTINSNGAVNTINVSSLPVRKTVNSLGNKTDIVHISNQVHDKVIIFYSNKHEPNALRVSVISKGTGNLKLLTYVEDTEFYIFPLTKETIVFKPHVDTFNKCKVCHIKIDNPIDFMKEETFSIIDLNKGIASHNKKNKVELMYFNS